MSDAIVWKPYTLSLRDGTSQAAEMGELLVTEDRPNHSSEQIKLKFVRLKSPSPKAPPVIFLAGGPGDSGIQWAQHPPFYQAFDRVRKYADVILLEQRGCGQSERKLTCAPPAILHEDSLASQESMFKFYENHLRPTAKTYKNDGTPLGAYTPADSADDLDDLRQALAVEKVILWGYSYGAHLAMAAVKRHPDGIERVVLCGFEGPDETWKMPSAVQRQLAKLANLCHAQSDSGVPDLLALMTRVHEKLAKAPVEVAVDLGLPRAPEKMKVGAFALQHLASTWMGVSNRFTALPRLYASLDAGKTGDLAKALQGFSKTWSKPLTFYLKDGASGATKGRLDQIAAEAGACLLGDAVNFPFPGISDLVGARNLGDGYRKPLRSELPFLVLTGSLDGNTPTEQALEGLKLLPKGHHLLVENAAHNDLISSKEGVTAIAKFVADGTPPEVRSVSLPVPKFRPWQGQ